MTRKRMERRSPRQDRSRALVESVREACRLILEEQGHDGLTTARIAERAGVSVGSLYQYFENKEHILAEVFREELEDQREGAERWASELAAKQMRDRLRAGIEYGAAGYRRMLELDSDFYRQNHAQYRLSRDFPTFDRDDERSSNAIEFTRKSLERDREQLRPRRNANLDHAAYIVSRGTSAILRAAVEDDPALLEDEQFLQEVFDLMACYLFRREGDDPAE